MQNKITAYILKLHTAAQYENCAFTVKQYSAELYNLLNTHAKEDRKQAEMLFQDAISSKEEEGLKAFNNVLMPLAYIDEAKEDQEAIALDVLDAFIWIEQQVYKQLTVHEKHGYAEISNFRITVLEEAKQSVESGTIFSSYHKNQWWKCANCGAVYIEEEAHSTSAEECHICGASQGSFVKHHQIGA